jgi:hypothetical protein
MNLAKYFPNLASLVVVFLKESHIYAPFFSEAEINSYRKVISNHFQIYQDNGHECSISNITIQVIQTQVA